MPATKPLHLIGKAAALSGVSVASIRFYEKEGLLAAGPRTANSYRAYTEGDIHQLRFIRLCRAMDMSLDEVRTLLNLDLSRKADCAAANAALQAHIAHVGERLAELQALQDDLTALRARCDGTGPQCRIMQALHERAEQLPREEPKSRAHRHV
ncbi:MAG: putative transcriptional regulator, MerR family [Polaromonas sp.]|nr:putative transcriptional regulator, MerR family [Polaromonas sp.]